MHPIDRWKGSERTPIIIFIVHSTLFVSLLFATVYGLSPFITKYLITYFQNFLSELRNSYWSLLTFNLTIMHADIFEYHVFSASRL